MKIEKYIKDNITRFTERFKDVKISYYQNNLSGSHILYFESSSKLTEEIEEFQADFLFEILEIYETESIVFSETLNDNKYLNLLFQTVGDEYSEFDWSSYEMYEEDEFISVEPKLNCKVVDFISDYFYALAA